MKLKYLICIIFVIPLLGLFIVNIFATNLSVFQVSSTNFVCLAVLLIGIVDILFITFKRYKLNFNKK
ncbi:hypothetical protein MTCD1_02959 [Colwellia marinimaniae]|uniref:Uncharacterized protein n=1 Tax=Colwellia marinimaniae TaxID=1513592 RepID=A0ABQ0MY74_9GAMM|nr:hypothetical protein MTCD1_02959 [Colwellia marinimaniae]